MKYTAGMPCSLAACTSGVVPRARSGLHLAHGSEVLLQRGAILHMHAARLAASRNPASLHSVRGQGGADIGHGGAGLDQQARYQQFRTFVAGDHQAGAMGFARFKHRFDRRQRFALWPHRWRRRDMQDKAAPIASSQRAVPSTPDRARSR